MQICTRPSNFALRPARETSPARSQMWGLPLQSGRKLIPFNSHFHFRFRWPATSGSVDSVISESESGMVEHMGVDVGIATPSLTVEKLFPLTV